MKPARLMWFGLFGAPVAFAVFHVTGFALSEARCDRGSGDLNLLVGLLMAAGAGIAVLATVSAVAAFRRTRDDDAQQRVHFMSIMGMTVSPLIAVIILMAGIGVLVLPECVQAQNTPPIVRSPGDVARSPRELGAQLFAGNCARCHGSRGEGVTGRGPSLKHVGALAADFYLTTGYMPVALTAQQPIRAKPQFHAAEIRALTTFVASLGPGPPIPRPRGGDVAAGREVFTQRCAGCHQVVGEGGIVTGAKVPPLDSATPRQVAEAVRIGPYLMPRFSAKAITPSELDDIVAYVRYAQQPRDAGGWAIDHLGPFPEGLVAWFIALGTLIATCVWIGSRLKA